MTADGGAVRALTFDVFGTVVDWRSSVAREAKAVLAPLGHELDWADFADRWRARYQPAMEQVRSGARTWTILDDLHRENLVALLADVGARGLADAQVDRLNGAWRRLTPWPDSVEGLNRLKGRYLLATCSNGDVSMMTDLARHSGLCWDAFLGAEPARNYKPAPEVYDRAAELLGLAPQECMMVAAHPYDLKSAAARGFRTAYVHRPLEFGEGREVRRPDPGAFDLAVDSLTALADTLA